ncbi:unnamed protein product, partial [Symbiodinium microadriaticum]
MRMRPLWVAAPLVASLRLEVIVPSLWAHAAQRASLRQRFQELGPELRAKDYRVELHFILGNPVGASVDKESVHQERAQFGDLVVLGAPENDEEMLRKCRERQAAAATTLGPQVLDEPSPAILRIAGALVLLWHSRPDLDFVVKLEDSVTLPLLPFFDKVLEHADESLLMGWIVEDFPVSVRSSNADEACETCPVPVAAERFCQEMIRVSMSGMDFRGCLRVASECCNSSGCDEAQLLDCTSAARAAGSESVLYYGTAFAPPFPLSAAWALGRRPLEFIVDNIDDLKMRGEVAEALLGFWLAGLEDLKIVDLSREISAD